MALDDGPVANTALADSSAHSQGADEPAVIIPAVDANGGLYPIEKLAAHRTATLHLAVSVFVFSRAALLIQRRAAGKYHCPGQWANTCCTHPHWEESLDDSAQRRLREELGLSLPLQRAGALDYRADVGGGLVEHERVQAYTAFADQDAVTTVLAPDAREVSETRWATREALLAEAAQAPGTLTPWLRVYLERWDELRLPRA